MNQKKHYVDIIFIIVLVGLFALSSVMLALLGVNVYRTSSTGTNGQNLDTASLYFAQKVRQCEDKSLVHVETLADDIPALVMDSTKGGKELETWFYVYDDTLKEVTVLKGNNVAPEYGQEIMSMKTVDYEIVSGDLLQVNMVGTDGSSSTINMHLAGGGEDD
ncbi:MAG: DUF4860 domain-containing protein [Firmicutes bacterium]|nr:DUF4860 domain-containing protein [Bacillota bacterium]